MTWVKLDDKRALNRKLRQAGLEARGLDEAAICWIAQEQTDGFISETDVAMLALSHGSKQYQRIVKKLIDAGRWERDDARKGYTIVNFLEFNPSKKDLEKARKAEDVRKNNARTRMRTLREQRGSVTANNGSTFK